MLALQGFPRGGLAGARLLVRTSLRERLRAVTCFSCFRKPPFSTIVEARKLEYDCPPTPKPRDEGKPGEVVSGPYSNSLESILYDTMFYYVILYYIKLYSIIS